MQNRNIPQRLGNSNEDAEKTSRNRDLYRDYKKGMSILDIQIKYYVSSVRVYQIINIMKKKEKNES
jgi:Mor family transcriptional regulator